MPIAWEWPPSRLQYPLNYVLQIDLSLIDLVDPPRLQADSICKYSNGTAVISEGDILPGPSGGSPDATVAVGVLLQTQSFLRAAMKTNNLGIFGDSCEIVLFFYYARLRQDYSRLYLGKADGNGNRVLSQTNAEEILGPLPPVTSSGLVIDTWGPPTSSSALSSTTPVGETSIESQSTIESSTSTSIVQTSTVPNTLTATSSGASSFTFPMSEFLMSTTSPNSDTVTSSQITNTSLSLESLSTTLSSSTLRTNDLLSSTTSTTLPTSAPMPVTSSFPATAVGVGVGVGVGATLLLVVAGFCFWKQTRRRQSRKAMASNTMSKQLGSIGSRTGKATGTIFTHELMSNPRFEIEDGVRPVSYELPGSPAFTPEDANRVTLVGSPEMVDEEFGQSRS